MQDPQPRSTQDPAMDLLAPAPEAFADLLARTLADLPNAEEVPAAPDKGEEPPRRSLIQRIIGRRMRRAAERETVPPEELSGDPAAAPAPEPPMEEDDVLVLEKEVEPIPEPIPEPEPEHEPEPEPEPEPEAEPESGIRIAIPAALTEDAEPFPGDTPGLLERIFGRRKSAAPAILPQEAISALPPLNGFVSEWLTYQSLLQGFGTTDSLLRLI